MITIVPSVAGMLIGLGIALDEPMAGLLAFVCALLWVNGLFVFVGLLTAWLLAGRKRRTEIFFGLLIGLMVIGGQLLPRLAETSWGRAAWHWLYPYWGVVSDLLAWTPISVWSFFFEHLSQGQVAEAYFRLLAVSVVFTGLVWAGGYAIFTKLATSARASSSQSTPGRAKRSTLLSSLILLKLPFASEQVAVIFAKELLYFTRNTATYLNALSALVLTLVAFGRSSSSLGRGFNHQAADWWDGLRVAFWVAYTFTLNTTYFVNSFGFDAAGFRQYLLAPLIWQRLLVGKNLALGLLVGIQVVLILMGAQLLYQELTWGKVYIALCATVTSAALYWLVGNFLSSNFPYRSEFGVRTRRSNERFSAANMVALFGLMLGSMALLALPFGLGYLFKSLTLKYYAFTALAAGASTIYALRVSRQGRKLEARRFEIVEALTRKTEKI
jgi:hypothetical protein